MKSRKCWNYRKNTNIYSTHLAIPFSLVVRFRRICSTEATFNTRAAQLTTYLLKWGYNRNFVTKQIRRPFDILTDLLYKPKTSTNLSVYHLFNPSLPHIPIIIKEHYDLLLSYHRCKKVFQHLLVVAFRDLLATAELSSNSANPQLPSGSFRCGKNCATCPYISHGLTTYNFFSIGETRPIKSNFTCDTKNPYLHDSM